jgi:hypothetical protein
MAPDSGTFPTAFALPRLTSQFCLGFGGGGYVLAAAYTNADTQKWSDRLGSGTWWRRGQGTATDQEIARAKQVDAAKVSLSCAIE